MTRRGKRPAQPGKVLDETSADALRVASDRLRGQGMSADQAAVDMLHDSIIDWVTRESDEGPWPAEQGRPRLRIVPKP